MYFGIDLGTTNSVISFAQIENNGKVTAAPIKIDRPYINGISYDGRVEYSTKREQTLPSFVFYDNGRVIVGDLAREQYKKYPELVAKSIKSQMGEPSVTGLSADVPDKTPEAISAKILSHLKTYGERMVKQRIEDVIITVPANFDAAQKEATMKAAAMAGFNVKDEDGFWKPILISEPNAVLYDLAQKILNGEVARTVLDFSTRKRVLVFDIGGGTLDVTFHELVTDDEAEGVLNISEIASSRYTRLAGDDFDEAIANVLYARCIERFSAHDPAAVPRIRSRENIVKKMLTVAAERLKRDMNSGASTGFSSGSDSWFDDFDNSGENEEFSCRISEPIGDERSYVDTVTRSEFETMIEHFLGRELTYEDFRGYSTNSKISRANIIAPILDVLEKAERYYRSIGDTDFSVDAVVLNGGMSKLYLVKERIEEFFGFEPITTADPDLSVANGAAVYASIMARTYGAVESNSKHTPIVISRHIQNNDIYLGLASGANDLLIAEGAELPFSVSLDGYSLIEGDTMFEVPIKRGVAGSDYPTIARGIVRLSRSCPADTWVKLDFGVDQTGLISIKAYMTADDGRPVGTATGEIAMGDNPGRGTGANRLFPADGSKLNAANELFALKQLFDKGCKVQKKEARIAAHVRIIQNCANPRDFEDVILKYLDDNNNEEFRYQLYRIARKLILTWSDQAIRNFREAANSDLVPPELASFGVSKTRTETSNLIMEIFSLIS